MNKPHVHADVIHAYADGKQIQIFDNTSFHWKDVTHPIFGGYNKYRVKPEPQPDTVGYAIIDTEHFLEKQVYEYVPLSGIRGNEGILRITRDGETNLIKEITLL